MLTDAECQDLLRVLYATAQVVGYTLSKEAAAMFVEDLEAFALDELHAALKRVRREVSGRFSLQDIVERVPGMFTPPNEAWALCLAGEHEEATVITNQFIQQAYEASKSVLAAGDRVGARMAFLETYKTVTAKAMASGQRPEWFVSLGTDRAGALHAIETARVRGLLTQAQASHHAALVAPETVRPADNAPLAIPPPKYPMPDPDQGEIAKIRAMSREERIKHARTLIRRAGHQMSAPHVRPESL